MTTHTSTIWLAIASHGGEPVPRAHIARATPGLTGHQRRSALQQALQRGYLQRTTVNGQPAVTPAQLAAALGEDTIRRIREEFNQPHTER